MRIDCISDTKLIHSLYYFDGRSSDFPLHSAAVPVPRRFFRSISDPTSPPPHRCWAKHNIHKQVWAEPSARRGTTQPHTPQRPQPPSTKQTLSQGWAGELVVTSAEAHELRSKTSKELLKELDEMKTELSQLRVAKVAWSKRKTRNQQHTENLHNTDILAAMTLVICCPISPIVRAPFPGCLGVSRGKFRNVS